MRNESLVVLLAYVVTACASAPEELGTPPVAILTPAGKADIYGEDGRRFIEDEGVAPWMRRLGRSVGAMVSPDNAGADGAVSFPEETTREASNYCAEERLVDERTVATCTVFLVAPDLVMTAGHCVPRGCNEGPIVFGLDRARAEAGYLAPETFRCARVEARLQSEGYDWALLRLDRATSLPSLQLAASDPAEGTNLALIGHGQGMPQQAVLGGVVLNEGPRSFFVTDLDAFGGSSGSPVFSMETREVVGILTSGGYDFAVDEAAECVRAVRCEEASGTGFGLECPGNRVNTLDLVRAELEARAEVEEPCFETCARVGLRPGECRSARECVGLCAEDTGCDDRCEFACDAYGYDESTCRQGWSCVDGCVVHSGCTG